NNVVDTRTYWGPEKNFRLEQITTDGSTDGTIQNLNYDDYTPTGFLKHIADDAFNAALTNTATFTYDDLNRLTVAVSNGYGTKTFEYGDHLGNLTKKDGYVYTYDAGHPHQATNAHTDALDHDMNGNRIARGGDSYHYTPDDRLWYVEDSSRTVRFLYDY